MNRQLKLLQACAGWRRRSLAQSAGANPVPVPVRAALLAVLLALAGLQPGTVQAEAVEIATERQVVLINLTGGLPGRWTSCVSACSDDGARTTLIRPTDEGTQLHWDVPGNADATHALETLEYEGRLLRSPEATTLILTSLVPVDGIRLIHRYAFSNTSRTIRASLQIPAGAQLRFRAGRDLAGEPLPGFGSFYSDARAVVIGADGQTTLDDTEPVARELQAGDWAGVRGRFWTLLVRADSPAQLAAAEPAPERPWLAFGRDSDRGGIVDVELYGGPVNPVDLREAAPELDRMLYASLWEWLRQLAFGLRWLLDLIHGWTGHWGLAIILLSLSVKVLMWPLTFVAERWQADVNRTQSRLMPQIAAIKQAYKGEEAHERTLAVYREHSVSPFFTLKSLAGFLIQIPVFIAAFDMLGEHFGLGGAGFLWVDDLSMPDRAFALPFALPFFGGHLNLMPVLMSAFTVAAARLQEDPALSPALLASQRLRLYAMAVLFFVLLYTFPAGMVLYWTTNNALHVAKILAGKALARFRQPAGPATGDAGA